MHARAGTASSTMRAMVSRSDLNERCCRPAPVVVAERRAGRLAAAQRRWRWSVVGRGRDRRGWRPMEAGRRRRRGAERPLRLAHGRLTHPFIWLTHPFVWLKDTHTPYMSVFANLPPASRPTPQRVPILGSDSELDDVELHESPATCPHAEHHQHRLARARVRVVKRPRGERGTERLCSEPRGS